MTWKIDSIEFDPIERTKVIVEAMGEVIPELLSQLSVESNPYKIDPLTFGVVTSYTLSADILNIETNITTTINLLFTSTGTETINDLYTNIITSFNNDTDILCFSVNLDYDLDQDKYFTLASCEGYAIVSEITTSNNISVTTEIVSANTGKPAAYIENYKQQIQPYPHIVAAPLDHREHSSNYNKGVVNVIGVGLRPYHEAYIKLRISLRCESGGYQNIISGKHKSSSFILNRLKRKLGREEYLRPFMEKIDASFNPDWTFNQSTYIEGLNNKDASTAIIIFDLVDRYVELEGGVLEAVSFVDGEFYLDDQLQMTNSPTTVQRPDYIP